VSSSCCFLTSIIVAPSSAASELRQHRATRIRDARADQGTLAKEIVHFLQFFETRSTCDPAGTLPAPHQLPQLLNVLAGDMSIVDRRASSNATAQNETFAKLISSFPRRHNVKPGLLAYWVGSGQWIPRRYRYAGEDAASRGTRPASCSFKIPMICSSEKRLRFMLWSLSWARANFNPD
jgi:hypothetical protein